MADTQTNTVILKVSLDEGQTEKQLAQLVLDIEATKKAQAALTAERKAGKLADEEFAAQAVKLKAELKAQQTEQTALTKNLDLYRTATGELGNTYKGVQAQLSLAQNQYKLLEGSQDTSSESAKALSATIDGLRGTLKATDEQQGLFVRNIGNYPKGESLEPLIQKIVQLEELQKAGVLTTQQAAQAEQAAIGFKQQFNQAAAAQGKTLQQAQNELKVYGEAVRPAVAELVKLESEQHKVAESAGKESKAYAEVGFKIGAARKEIQQVAPATELTASASEKAAAGLGKLSGTASKLPGPLGQTVGGLAETGKGLLSATKAALAFIATPLGAFLALITGAFFALKEALTATDEGQETLAAGTAALKAVFSVLETAVISVGNFLIKLFTEPKEAASELLDFLESQVLNRIKAFGVLFDALRKGDFKQAVNGALQLSTGIENVVGKTQALTAELKRAGAAAAAISREKDILEDREIAAVALNEKQRQQAERLVLTAKDRNLTEKQRLDNLAEAGRLETEVLNRTKGIEETRLRILKEENAERARTGKLQDDERRAEQEQEAKVLQLQGEYEKEQQVIANRRSVLQKEEAAAQQAATKAAAEAAKQRAKDAVAAKQTENELALLEVRKGSAAELVLKQRGIDLAADMELAGEKKSIAQVKLVRAKAESDKLDLRLAFDAKEVEEAKKRTAAQNAEIKREYEEAAQLLTQYLDTKRAEVERAQAAGLIGESEAQRQLNAIEKAGYNAALVNAQDYNQDKAKIIKAGADLEIKETKRVADEKKKLEQTKQQVQDASLKAAQGTTSAIISLYGEESAAGQAAVALKKTLALVEIGINLERELSANALAGKNIAKEIPAPAGPVLGAAYIIAADAASIAAAGTAAATILGFRDGGVLQGASHEQGGIPFTVDGRPGFEAEHNEVILTRGVWENPLLRPLASTLNVLGGGTPLMPRAHMALGGVASSQAANLLAGIPVPVIDYRRLATAMGNVNLSVSVRDTKAAAKRDAFTQARANA